VWGRERGPRSAVTHNADRDSGHARHGNTDTNAVQHVTNQNARGTIVDSNADSNPTSHRLNCACLSISDSTSRAYSDADCADSPDGYKYCHSQCSWLPNAICADHCNVNSYTNFQCDSNADSNANTKANSVERCGDSDSHGHRRR
jgi:hypothetical protein